jgi:hypothetical protein
MIGEMIAFVELPPQATVDVDDEAWCEVHNHGILVEAYHIEGMPDLGTYYQCWGGGPEGGYVSTVNGIYEINRNWGECWKATHLPGRRLTVCPEGVAPDGLMRCKIENLNEPLLFTFINGVQYKMTVGQWETAPAYDGDDALKASTEDSLGNQYNHYIKPDETLYRLA